MAPVCLSKHRRVRLTAALLASTALLAAAWQPARAADATWLANPGSNDFNTGANWTGGTVPNGTASFDASTTTALTFSSGTTLGGLTFNAGAPAYSFTFGANTLFINGAGIDIVGGSASFTNNGSAVIAFTNSATAGSASFNNNRALQFLIFSTAGSATIVNSGFLSFFNSSTGGNAAITNTGAAAVTDFSNSMGPANDFKLSAGSIAGTGAFRLGGNELTVGGNNTSTTVSGTIEDGGLLAFTGASLVKTGTGTLTLTGTNTYSGGTTVTGGLVNFTTGSNLGTGNVTLNGGGLQWASGNTLDISSRLNALGASGGTFDTNSNDVTLASVISGGALTKSGAGTLILSGTNTYSGGTTIGAGTVSIGAAANIGSGAVSLNGGTLQATGSFSLANTVNATASGSSIDTGANTLTLTGTLGGSNSFTKSGSGTLTFGSALDTSGHSGGLTLSQGTLSLQASLAAGFGTITTTGSVIDYANGVDNAAAIDINSNTTQLQVTTGTATQSGVISETSGPRPMEKIGAGTLILSAANTYTGDTTVTAGTLQIGAGGTSGSIAGNVVNNATLAFNRSDALSFGGNISGNGAVTKSGAGTLTLSGTNDYSGGTTISGGTVSIGAAGNIGSGAVSLNGGTLLTTGSLSLANTVNASAGGSSIDTGANTLTLTGTLGGSNSFTKSGTGTLIFGSALDTSGHSGGLTLSQGTLSLQASLAAGFGTITTTGSVIDYANGVDNAAAIDINSNTTQLQVAAGTATQSGAISETSGPRPMEKIGAGTLILSAANTYTGDTTVTAGTLQIGAGGTSGSVVGNIVDNAALTFNRSDALTYAGVISGTGSVTQNGSGNLILSNTHTYAGATTVNAGTLSVNGDISLSSGVTVNNGGILGGTGTVSSTTINSGGALAPGNSIGTVTVSGNLVFNAGSSYNVEVSPSAADRTNAIGTATLNGTVNASYQAGTYTAKQYTILNATGGVSGTFGTLANTSLPNNVSAALSYDANNVYLNLTLNYMAPGGSLSGNQQNVANALTSYFNSTGGIPTAFASLSSNGLSQIAGEPGAGVQQMVFTGAGLFMNSVFDNAFGSANGVAHTGQGGGASAYAPARKLSREARDAYAAVTPRERGSEIDKRWGVWAAAYGGSASVSGDGTAGTHDTTSHVYGATAGADYRASEDTRLGFALGGAGSSFSLAEGFGSGKADIFNAALYGRQAFGASYVAAALGYSWQDASTDRTVTAAGTGMLHASFHPQALTARVETGHRFDTSIVGIAPYAGLQSTTFFLPSYDEAATSGSNQFALTYDSRKVTATRGELGARFDKTVALMGASLTLKAKAAWAHDWNRERAANATFQQLPGAAFTVNGAEPAADSVLASAGAELALGGGWTVAAKFDGEYSRTTASYAGRGSVRFTW